MFDKNKFKGKIAEKGLNIGKVASLLGINEATLHRKINGQSDFNRSEIQMLREILDLDIEAAEDIFFAQKLA